MEWMSFGYRKTECSTHFSAGVGVDVNQKVEVESLNDPKHISQEEYFSLSPGSHKHSHTHSLD